MAYRLNNKEYYNNRELSWLRFNYRVIEEAADPNNPLLEKLKFLAITSSNLDEFFMVRVAGLKDQVKMNYHEPDTKTQMTPGEQLAGISELNRENSAVQYDYFHRLMAELETYDIYLKRPYELPEHLQDELEEIFDTEIFPSLTPLGIDAYRPFPKLMNKKINIFINLSNDWVSRLPSSSCLQSSGAIMNLKMQAGPISYWLKTSLKHTSTSCSKGIGSTGHFLSGLQGMPI